MSLRLALMSAAALLLAAGTAAHGIADEPATPAPAPVPVTMPQAYHTACATCHVEGGFGARVLADRAGRERSVLHEGTPLPGAALRAIVRGGLGHMPAMSKVDVSDAELDAIVIYLTRDQR